MQQTWPLILPFSRDLAETLSPRGNTILWVERPKTEECGDHSCMAVFPGVLFMHALLPWLFFLPVSESSSDVLRHAL
jgi:hypothetical protein